MITFRYLRAGLLGVAGVVSPVASGVAQQAASSSRAESAPARLTLAEAIAAAHRVSADLIAAREAVTAAVARERQAGAFANPTLAYSREQTSGGDQSNSQNLATIDQPIEPGGLRSARRDVARFQREVAEARRAAAEVQLDYEVARAYALAVAADRRATLAQQAAEAFAQALRASESRLAAGDVSGYANRRIRLEAARYTSVRAEATLARRSARRALATMVMVEPTQSWVAAVELIDSMPRVAIDIATDSLVALALRSRAELRVSRGETQAAQAEARLAARERVPVPVVSGGLKTERTTGVEDGLRGFAAGVAIPLPLWNRGEGAVQAAEAGARRRVAETESLRRRVAREVSEAADAYRATAEQVAILTPQLGPEATAALRSAQVAYAEGEASLVEWLDAVRAYHEAESGFASLQADLLVRRAALERAVGARQSPSLTSGGATAPTRRD
jgi:cobalt-zinc-cadmium efflux system outer membrane protein